MIVDVNANLSRWPFRRTPCDELPRLVESCRKHGVGQVWVGSLDGLFHRDLDGVNRRLVEECRSQRRLTPDVELLPFGSVNPTLPDWQEDLRRCAEDYHMPGIRLHPNYHGYGLTHPSFAELLALVTTHRLIVQLVVRMDDVRVQPPLMKVPDVDPNPLAAQLKARPALRLVVLNGLRTLHGAELTRLAAAGQVWFDIAMKEVVGGVAELVRTVPPHRVLFGSHLPLFCLEAAVLKMREAGLDDRQRADVEYRNAQRLLSQRGSA